MPIPFATMNRMSDVFERRPSPIWMRFSWAGVIMIVIGLMVATGGSAMDFQVGVIVGTVGECVAAIFGAGWLIHFMMIRCIRILTIGAKPD